MRSFSPGAVATIALGLWKSAPMQRWVKQRTDMNEALSGGAVWVAYGVDDPRNERDE